MHGKSRVYLFAITFNKGCMPVAVAQWVHAGGSSPDGDSYQIFFSNDFYFSFARPNEFQ